MWKIWGQILAARSENRILASPADNWLKPSQYFEWQSRHKKPGILQKLSVINTAFFKTNLTSVIPFKHCKKNFLGTPTTLLNKVQPTTKPLQITYLFSNTSIGNAMSGKDCGWGHWKAFTVPTKLWVKSCRNDVGVVEGVWLWRISGGYSQ